MPFKSTVGDYQTVATLETFGFLPPMTQDEIYDQIAYIIAQGWSPLVEHIHPSRSRQYRQFKTHNRQTPFNR